MPLLPIFGIASSPFRLTFPVREAFAHRSWERVRKAALDAVAGGERIVLVGEPGTGKTLLLQALERSLRAQDFEARHVRPGEMLEAPARREVLLIDEADLLEEDELERFCGLPNSIILTGLPGLEMRLGSSPRPFRVGRLERLGPEDIARFVRTRLDASDEAHPMFTPDAVLALMRQSGGLFRLVTILAGAALFFAEQRRSCEVIFADVDEAAALRLGALEEPEEEADPSHAFGEPARAVADLEPGASQRWRPVRLGAAAGWAGLVGASLALVIAAIVGARAVVQIPPLQIVARSPTPTLAAPVPPGPSFAPVVLAVSPSPPTLAAPVRPVMANLPPPPEPIASADSVPKSAPSDAGESTSLATNQPQAVLVFSGGIMNDTMGQAGQLSLKVMTSPAGGRVGALFHASHGLIGTGMLSGAIGPGGMIRLAGRLMMGRNPFECRLHAKLVGDRLIGEATFVHLANGAPAHSTFTLSRL